MVLDDSDADVIAEGIRLAGAPPPPDTLERDLWLRVWPPSPAAGIAGNSLGFLRYCPRDPTAALRVDCELAYSLTLDRHVTAPNAVVGVSFLRASGSRGAWQYLFPGETVYVPAGFRHFWLYNADNLDAIALFFLANLPLGHCGFTIGLRPGTAAPSQLAPLPLVRTIHSAFSAASPRMAFGAGRVRRVVVRARPVDAANQGLNNVAFSFQVQLEEWGRLSDTPGHAEALDLDLGSVSWFMQGGLRARFRGKSYPNGGYNDLGTLSIPIEPGFAHAVSSVDYVSWGQAIDHLLYVIEAD